MPVHRPRGAHGASGEPSGQPTPDSDASRGHSPGHTDPALALRVYRQAMRRGEREKEQQQALVEGADFGDRADAGERQTTTA
jgi:hypothetical protein